MVAMASRGGPVVCGSTPRFEKLVFRVLVRTHLPAGNPNAMYSNRLLFFLEANYSQLDELLVHSYSYFSQ